MLGSNSWWYTKPDDFLLFLTSDDAAVNMLYIKIYPKASTKFDVDYSAGSRTPCDMIKRLVHCLNNNIPRM